MTKSVVYKGWLLNAWIPDVGKSFTRDEPVDVSDEDAAVLLALDGEEQTFIEAPVPSKPKSNEKKEGGE